MPLWRPSWTCCRKEVGRQPSSSQRSPRRLQGAEVVHWELLVLLLPALCVKTHQKAVHACSSAYISSATGVGSSVTTKPCPPAQMKPAAQTMLLGLLPAAAGTPPALPSWPGQRAQHSTAYLVTPSQFTTSAFDSFLPIAAVLASLGASLLTRSLQLCCAIARAGLGTAQALH